MSFDILHSDTMYFLLKVTPYSIQGSLLIIFLFEYMKTEFNDDNGTCIIEKVTSHSCRIMVSLSISAYFLVIWHP